MADDQRRQSDLSHTLEFMRCTRCGNIFVASISGYVECPECSSIEAVRFRPDDPAPAQQ